MLLQFCLCALLIGSVLGALPTPTKNTFFASNSAYRSKLPDNAPISKNSALYVADFWRQMNFSGNKDRAFGDVWVSEMFPIYRADADAPTSPVILTTKYPDLDLQAASKNVPVPPNPVPEKCCDHEIIFYKESTDEYWEYYLWTFNETMNTAVWGGYMANSSSNPAIFGNPHPGWGAAATSLPIGAGLLTIADAYAGVFPYAIRLSIQDQATGLFVPPAQRTDGDGGGPIPEGTRFRLPASFDPSTIQQPFARALATALRDYGMITTDTSMGMPVLSAEATYQYTGFNGSLWPAMWNDSYPTVATRLIPWNLLEVVDPSWQPWNPTNEWYQEGTIVGPSNYTVTAAEVVFNNSIQAGWQDYSWNTPITFVPMDGGVALSAVFSPNAGALYLHTESGNIDTTTYNALEFTIQATAGNQILLQEQCLNIFQLVSGKAALDGEVRMCTLFNYGMPETWATIQIPFADMGWIEGVQVQGFWLQSMMRVNGQSTLYVREIRLINLQPVSEKKLPPKQSFIH